MPNRDPRHKSVSRRHFSKWCGSNLALGAAAIGGAALPHSVRSASAAAPSERLNIACIGVGGRGAANLSGVQEENVVALCDVDERRAAKSFEKYESARRFSDFRRMFDEMDRDIDAVVISTPDHTHFHPAWWAIERGKHIYLEKPLAHEVVEVRRLTEAARVKNVATQLGCQRHALTGLRAGVEFVRSGMIGEVREVHSWVKSGRGMPAVASRTDAPPTGLAWDLWLGPAPERPYSSGFAPYDWRFWWEFGTGETGNWGCHILDIPFWALELGRPIHVSASGPEPDLDRTPKALQSRLDFAARTSSTGTQLPPVSLHWYQGIPGVLSEKGIDPKLADKHNTLFIGSEGLLLCGFGAWKLLPAGVFADVSEPPRTLDASPGFHREWLNACRGEARASCHFDYAGPLPEAVLLANIAYRVQGDFAWDGDALRSSRADANALLTREYRTGWTV